MERYWPLRDTFGAIDGMLKKFKDGLIRTGLPGPATNDRLAWLEVARHHGVPAPLLDLSRSPYVALFFAFNRVDYQLERGSCSAVYALNVSQLAKHYAREMAEEDRGSEFKKIQDDFLFPGPDLFKDGFPDDTIRFLPHPGEHSPRMQQQLGAFLYCTLDYGGRGVSDLEGYLESLDDSLDSPVLPNTGAPTLFQFRMPHSMAGEVLERLELANVTGASLFATAEGIADDIWNSFHYSRQLWVRTDEEIGS